MASFGQTYPSITRWVKRYGWIEIGNDGMSPTWARGLDEGGLIWGGGDPSKPLDETLQALEAALSTFIREQLRLRE